MTIFPARVTLTGAGRAVAGSVWPAGPAAVSGVAAGQAVALVTRHGAQHCLNTVQKSRGDQLVGVTIRH